MELNQQVEVAIIWIRTHQERFWTIVGGSVLAIALAIFVVRHHQTETDEAWTQLGPLQGQVMQANAAVATSKALEDWEKRFASTSAGPYEQFLKADLLYRTSDYAGAAVVYGALAEKAPIADMRPLGLSGQSSAEEMAGHVPQALSLAQGFTQRYPDHFLAASMYFAQGRLNEMAGNPTAASAIYDRVSILYPQSPFTPLARARIQALSGSPAPTAPK